MLSLIKISFLILLPLLSKGDWVNINCNYGYGTYDIEIINRCLVDTIDVVRHENMDVNVKNIQTANGHQNNPSNIEGFEADTKQIFFFPGKIGRHFPNIRAVRIRSSSLRKITSEDFQLLINLEFLDLSNNLVLTLPANLFQYTQKLEIIKLKNNRINYIHPTAFNGLMGLKNLDIYDNTCYTGSAKNIEQALIISNVSLCSEELLYSCGAFSHALNLLISKTSVNDFNKLKTLGKVEDDNLKTMNYKMSDESQTMNQTDRINLLIELINAKNKSNIQISFTVYAMIIMASIMFIISIVIMCYLLYQRNENKS